MKEYQDRKVRYNKFMIKGIDISSWQKDPNFEQVKTQVQFVITKVTENINYTNPNFKRSQSECRRLDILLGYYHFAKPTKGNTPEVEAEYFLKQLGELKNGEIICLDYEENYADCVNWCKKWLDYVYAKLGCKPLIYLNKSTVSSFNWKPIVDAGYGLWLADYTYSTNSPIPATPWPVMAIRQYSNKEVVAGIAGGVDADVFYGDAIAFKKYGYKEVDPCEQKVAEALGKQSNYIAGLENSNRDLRDAAIDTATFINKAWAILDPTVTDKKDDDFIKKLQALKDKLNIVQQTVQPEVTTIQPNPQVSSLLDLLRKFFTGK